MADLVEKKKSDELEESLAKLSVKEEENDEDDDEEEEGEEGGANGEDKKKRKKRNKKKKKKAAKKEGESAVPAPNAGVPEKVPPSRVIGGYTDYYVKYGQTEPPTIPVADLFSNKVYPEGEILPHGLSKDPVPNSFFYRETAEEKR